MNIELPVIEGVVRLTHPPYGGNSLSIFTGNQWNEDWSWDRAKLEQLSEDELWDIWLKHKPNWIEESL